MILGLLMAASASAQPGFSGDWRPSGSEAERDARYAAIDRATESLNVFVRGAARGRIRSATQPPPLLRVTDQGVRVTFGANGRNVTLPTDGTPTEVSGERGSGVMTVRRDGERLVVTARGENGVNTTVYRLSEDGRRLLLDVRLESERLGAPVRYRVTFHRQ